MSVYEFQKLLVISPVRRSGCEPASAVSVRVTSTNTTTRPDSCDAASLRSAAVIQGNCNRTRGFIRPAKASVWLIVRRVGGRIGMFGRRAGQRRPCGGSQIRECSDAHRGKQGGAVGGSFLPIHGRDWNAEHLGLKLANERALRAAAGEQHLLGRDA